MNHPLITIAAGAELVAIAPAQALSWHKVTLPDGTLPRGGLGARRNVPRLRAVLEGLLEDQLLDDPAQLHFALQPGARNDAPVWVAVCDRLWLRDALNALEQTGRAPTRIVPEWAPTDKSHPVLWATGAESEATLVCIDETGVRQIPVITSQGADTAVNTPLTGLLPADFATRAELIAEPAVAHLAEQLLHREARVVTTAQRLQEATQTDWNLAQFDMAVRNPLVKRMAVTLDTLRRAPQWRPARWAVLAMLVTPVVGLNLVAWKAGAHLEQQRTAIRNSLTTTFPQLTVVVDAPLQMDRAVAALRQSRGSVSNRDLEDLLGKFGAFSALSPATSSPTAIEFIAGELRLTGTGVSTGNLSSLETLFLAQGLVANLEGGALVLKPARAP
jgi:general secretion pathway protein L